MDSKITFPMEIINQILDEFVDNLERLRGRAGSLDSSPDFIRSSYIELTNLRLVSRDWSEAVLPFYYETIVIMDSARAQTILDTWKADLFGPHFSCPVRTLSIRNLRYSEERSDCADNDNDDDDSLGPGQKRFAPVSMDQVASLIELVGKNLKTLELCFVYHNDIGASPRLTKAIENIEDLKSFFILSGHKRLKHRTRNLNSISELFSAMPKIQWLKFMCGAIKQLDLKPPALANLRCLSFCYNKNSKVFSNIIQTSKSTLKFVELNSDFEECEDLIQIFEPIQDTLEGLGTLSFSEDLPAEFSTLNFPKLRVLIDQSTRPYNSLFAENDHCLASPISRNVRTIVTDICSTTYRSYWDLSDLRDDLEEVPNFKYLVLTKEAWMGDVEIPPNFVDGYGSRGVQLHVTNEFSGDELMELDLKLNGPMN